MNTPITLQPVTPDEIAEYLESRRLSATWLAYTLGVTKATTGRWLNHKTPIPAPMDKLLRVLIRGENPFMGDSPKNPGELDFTAYEWRLFEIIRLREGFPSVHDWIAEKIRDYVKIDKKYRELVQQAEAGKDLQAPAPTRYPTAAQERRLRSVLNEEEPRQAGNGTEGK